MAVKLPPWMTETGLIKEKIATNIAVIIIIAKSRSYPCSRIMTALPKSLSLTKHIYFSPDRQRPEESKHSKECHVLLVDDAIRADTSFRPPQHVPKGQVGRGNRGVDTKATKPKAEPILGSRSSGALDSISWRHSPPSSRQRE